ncbi:MAG: translesion error-prone DNA polymerase V autoproteolytic subunit [Methylobacterium sp.]|nr:translesion error-prone DNA polymerase V autoproteolytic subunit [Methylobacterium sp.]
MTNRGGKRPNAGRKPGSGPWSEQTIPVRVPASEKQNVIDFLQARRQKPAMPWPDDAMMPPVNPPRLAVPLFSNRIPAGFPSPADDHIEAELDFNELLVKNPPATFSLRVKGNSMTGAGIFDGDILVVDRSIEARDGLVVVAEYEGGYTVKRLYQKRGKVKLLPENPEFPVIELKEGQELVVFGVVTNVIHPVK